MNKQTVGDQNLLVTNDNITKLLDDKGALKHKLLLDPKGYASKAVEVLEEQLSSARTENKKNKLRHRIEKWKKTIEVLGE